MDTNISHFSTPGDAPPISRLDISTEELNDFVIIFISDTGNGIPPDIVNSVKSNNFEQ